MRPKLTFGGGAYYLLQSEINQVHWKEYYDLLSNDELITQSSSLSLG